MTAETATQAEGSRERVAGGLFAPGNRMGLAGGRPKGSPNKVTSELRHMIVEALDNAGGVEYLTRQADENPVAFLGLVGKCLPKDVTLEADGNVTIKILTGIPEELGEPGSN